MGDSTKLQMGKRVGLRLGELEKLPSWLAVETEASLAAIWALIDRNSSKSKFASRIAIALGVTDAWLLDGKLPKLRNELAAALVDEGNKRTIEPTPEELAMEVARQVSALVEAWLTLPRGEREAILRDTKARALTYRGKTGAAPELAVVQTPAKKEPTPIRQPTVKRAKRPGPKK